MGTENEKEKKLKKIGKKRENKDKREVDSEPNTEFENIKPKSAKRANSKATGSKKKDIESKKNKESSKKGPKMVLDKSVSKKKGTKLKKNISKRSTLSSG